MSKAMGPSMVMNMIYDIVTINLALSYHTRGSTDVKGDRTQHGDEAAVEDPHDQTEDHHGFVHVGPKLGSDHEQHGAQADGDKGDLGSEVELYVLRQNWFEIESVRAGRMTQMSADRIQHTTESHNASYVTID